MQQVFNMVNTLLARDAETRRRNLTVRTYKVAVTALPHVILTRCAFQFRLFPTFLLSVPLLVVICSYPGQSYNSATGHFVWLVRLPGTVYHWTFVRHLHYQRSKTCSNASFLTFLLHWLTVSRVRAANIVYGALVVTLAMLLRLINCRFIIIIIIIIRGWRGNGESGNTALTVMTFGGNDIQRKNWTANMYVAEELWSFCWTRFYYSTLVSEQKQHTEY